MKPWVQVVSLVVCVLGAAPAAAQPASTAVALLPLDAEPRLEIYGQPVASEIARALVVGGVDVVVVGPKMAVPDRARLILDGSIKADKGDAVMISVRVRDRMTGMTLEKLGETATNLGTIDRAAAQLSSRVLPIVQRQLAALPPRTIVEANPPPNRVPEDHARTVPTKPPTVLVGVAVSRATAAEPLRVALGESLATWVRDSRREPMPVDASTLDPRQVQVTVAAAHAERALAFEILGYSITGDRQVPLARARVRVRIADMRGIPFDRVVITDTIVGARNMPQDALAALVAREVLSILRPHMRKVEPQWR